MSNGDWKFGRVQTIFLLNMKTVTDSCAVTVFDIVNYVLCFCIKSKISAYFFFPSATESPKSMSSFCENLSLTPFNSSVISIGCKSEHARNGIISAFFGLSSLQGVSLAASSAPKNSRNSRRFGSKNFVGIGICGQARQKRS